jgi:diguanylate cyclase (GGDEF)-like protein
MSAEVARAVLMEEPSTARWRTMRSSEERTHPIPHRKKYAAIASMLSLAAPAGFLVLECALAGRIPSEQWLAGRISSRPEIYAYLFLSSFAVLAGLGFMLGKKQDELEAAWTDELTELASRRLFAARLKDEIRRSGRMNTPLALLLIDVDHLKEINDRGGGHELGDFALRAVAQSLRSTCRNTDLPARFGGDEFAVVAPFAAADQGLELAARIQKALRLIRIGPPSAPLSLTVSIGVADLTRAHPRTPETLCDAADRALYLAKSRGRDCVAVLPIAAGCDLTDDQESANDSVPAASGQ